MKLFKRNMVVLTVLMFVCVAVYLNWSYARSDKQKDSVLKTEAETNLEPVSSEYAEAEDVGLFYTEERYNDSESTAAPVETDYFAAARLSREQSRDSAVSLLRQTAESSDASQQIIDKALSDINVMAEYTLQEMEVENILLAKGFKECLVFVGADSVDVAVFASENGLNSTQVAQIMDVVVSETGFTPENINIIEVK